MDSRSAAGGRAGRDRLFYYVYRRFVLQLIEAAGGDNFSRIDAFDLGYTSLCNSRLDAAHLNEIVLNHIRKRGLAVLLNGRRWKQRHPLQGIYQQSRVYKLVREERVIFVVEKRSPFYCPGRSVDLVVERQQLAACDLRLRRSIEGIDGEAGVLAHADLNLIYAVLRYRKNYSDRFQLRNDCEGYGSGRLHYVA